MTSFPHPDLHIGRVEECQVLPSPHFDLQMGGIEGGSIFRYLYKATRACTGIVPEAGSRLSAAIKFMIKFVYNVIIIAPTVSGSARVIYSCFHFLVVSLIKREK